MVASSYFECITARSFCAQILLKPKPHFFATVMDQINWIGKYVQSRSTYSHGNQKWKRNSRKFATVSVSRFLTMTVCTKFQEQVNPNIFNYRYSLHLLLFLRLRRIWFQIPITFSAIYRRMKILNSFEKGFMLTNTFGYKESVQIFRFLH